MTRLSICLRAALVIGPLALAGCSAASDPNASPTNGGATQSTGIGSNGPASASGGPGSAAASHG